MHMSAASIHAKRGRRPNQLYAVRCAFNLLNFKSTRETCVHPSQRTVYLAFRPRRGQGDVDAGGERRLQPRMLLSTSPSTLSPLTCVQFDFVTTHPCIYELSSGCKAARGVKPTKGRRSSTNAGMCNSQFAHPLSPAKLVELERNPDWSFCDY